MKTSELTGPALDWAVAVCEGWVLRLPLMGSVQKPWFERTDKTGIFRRETWELLYSTDRSQGGLLIEREKIDVAWSEEGWYANMYWRGLDIVPAGAAGESLRCIGDGPTPLIAAMRCFVASRLGDEVEVPWELL